MAPSLSGLFPTLRGYNPRDLRADLVGGLTASAVILPQAMAYATIAGVPVQIGLYSCMVPAVVYGVLGGSRALNVSTTSTVATLTASGLLAASVASGSKNPIPDLVMLTLTVGLILIVARLLRLGSVVENVSAVTLVGIRTGTGLTIAATQLPKLLGLASPPSGSGFFATIAYSIGHLSSAMWATVILSICAIGLLLLLGRLWPKIPGALVIVVLGIGLVSFTGLATLGVALIAPVTSGLPALVVPNFGAFATLLPTAFAVAIMAFLESISAARSTKASDEAEAEPNRELLALGAASVLGAWTQVLPAAGGFSQAAVARDAGVRSQIASVASALVAVLVALFLGPVLSDLPQAILGALVLVAAVRLVSIQDFRRLARLSPVEAWLAIGTAAVAVIAGLLAGVVVGVAATLILVLRELNRSQIAPVFRRASGAWSMVSQPGDVEVNPELVVLHLTSPLYAANVKPTVRAVYDRAAERTPFPSVVVFEVSGMPAVSTTILDALQGLDEDLAAHECRLYLVGVSPHSLALARRSEWFASIQSAERVQPTIDLAVAASATTPTAEA